jgi:glucokinase
VVPEPAYLAADIGGTHARFRLVRGDAVVDEASLPTAAHDSLESACAAFLARGRSPRIARACIAVAGPVDGGRASLTNAPWQIDRDAFARRFDIDETLLCNDFEAAGFALDDLDERACHLLQGSLRDTSARAPRLLIGAGTGLGVAYVLPGDRGPRVVAGEGGHVGFAPADEEQLALWRFLRRDHARLTAELVVSGPGLVRLYAFAAGSATLPDDVRSDGAAAVAARFAAGEPAARDALRLFVSLYGAVAGDHAMSVLATGGVYLAGGIAPRFVETFRDGRFVAAFSAKGSHASLMRRMPIVLVGDAALGIAGAMRRARYGI